MQYIPNDPVPGSLSSSSFNTGLQQLLQMKMQKMNDRHKMLEERSRLEESLKGTNLTPDQYLTIIGAKGSPDIQNRLMNLFGSGQQMQQEMQPQIDSTGISNLQKLMQLPQQDNQFQNQMVTQAMSKLGLSQGQQKMPPLSQSQITQMTQPKQQPMAQPTQQQYQYLKPSEQLALKKLESSQQNKIISSNKKFNADVTKDFMNALAAKEKAQEALSLINTGKTRSGVAGYAPLWIANAETRELSKIYEDLALTLASSTSGALSRAKLIAAKATKPSLDMPLEAQKYLLNRIIDKSDREGIALDNIRERIIAENNGIEPMGLENKVMSEWKKEYLEKKDNKQVDSKINESQDENLVEYLTRQGVRSASRIGGAAAGSLGDIAGAGLGALNYLSKGKTPTYSDVQNKLPFSPPTSEQIAEKIAKWTGGYTEPKGSLESLSDDILSTFGSIFAPAKIVGPLVKGLTKLGASTKIATGTGKVLLPFSGVEVPWKTALGLSAGGEMASKTTEAFGGGPVPQTIAKLAFMTSAGIAGTRNALEETAAKSYEKAAKLFGDDTVSIKNASGKVTELKNKLIREAIPHKELMMEIIDEVKTGLDKSGNMKNINELINMKQNLNKRFKWSERPRIAGEKNYLPQELREPLGDLIDIIKKPIARAGLSNPEAGINFARADDITKGLRFKSDASHWLTKNSDLSPKHGIGGLHHTIFNLIKGGVVIPFREINKLRDLFYAYPSARQYYLDAIKSAANQNKAAFVNNMAKLDKISEKI